MKRKIYCYLVSLSFLIGFTSPVCSYTLIFKTGKKLEATWLSENQQTIRIKDKEGVVLYINKSLLDLKAMAAESRFSVKQAKLPPEPAKANSVPARAEASPARELPVKNNTSIQDTIATPTPPGLPPEIAKSQSDSHKPGQRLSVFTSLYNGYDSNIDHDAEPVESVGVVYGGGVKFRNRPKDPSFWISYEIANHHYTNTDKWDRVSQSILTAYTIVFSEKLQLQNLGEISFKGSSEDRELSDNYVFRPMLQYRMTDSDRFNFFVAQRFKRFEQVDNVLNRNANNKFVGFGYEREFSKYELQFVYKYEKNNGDSDRNDYIRSTYSVEYKMPFLRRNIASFEFKVRPTRFFHRFAEIEVNNGPDIEIPRRDIKWNFTVDLAIPLGNHLELIPSYEFEKRTSNDVDQFYTAHLPSLTLNYVW